MLKNYITVTLRNIRRTLGYSSINVFGLALGITCSLVLFLMVSFYTSFDNYHLHASKIYRVVNSSSNNGKEDFTPGVPVPLPEAIRNDVSGLEAVLFISGSYDGLFTVEENGRKNIFEQDDRFGFTDSTFFSFFDRSLISGDYKTALNEPNQVLLSQTIAKKFFGDKDAMNRTVRLNNSIDLKVVGVMEDAPPNTNVPFEILISYSTIKKEKESSGWWSVSSDDQCYVMLKEGVTSKDIDRQFPDLIEKYQKNDSGSQVSRWLQPLSDLSHDSRFSNYRYTTISKSTIMAMMVIAIFLIITASINFINLSTAVAVKRSKEVGIRKVLGGQRVQLIIQYLAETGIITFVAVILSIGFAELALIQLNTFLELNLHVDFTNSNLIVFLLGVWFLVSIISGFYPALLLSGFSPAMALKNKITNRSTGGFALRRGLVVFQFVISQLLIIGTVILMSQMNFLRTKDLGFAKDAIISVPIPEEAPIINRKALKTSITRLGEVGGVSLCSALPSSGSISTTNVFVDGIEGDYRVHVKEADKDYLALFQIPLIAGRGLVESDTANACVVNKKFLKTIGWEDPEEILGRNLKVWGKTIPIVGVTEDFHTTSLTREIDPVILFSWLEDYRSMAVKVESGSLNNTLQEIERQWELQYPDFLFSYEFLDQQIAEFYENEDRMSTLLVIFSVIAITIGCFGLYGLISFMANEKEKEIGIRKVLGASIGNILFIFSREFIVLIVIAFVLACPLAAYIMNQWLGNFAYRVDLGISMFISGILMTIVIALVTVGYRSLRAAITNPIDALRNE